jgi:DNA-binding NarL/FixJ family response regulator
VLTRRQYDVLRCLLAGYSEQRAAKRLRLKFYTVHCHVRAIRRSAPR